MRYRLRTLLIVLAVLPPVLAGGYFQWNESTEVFVLIVVVATCWILIPLFLLWLARHADSSTRPLE